MSYTDSYIANLNYSPAAPRPPVSLEQQLLQAERSIVALRYSGLDTACYEQQAANIRAMIAARDGGSDEHPTTIHSFDDPPPDDVPEDVPGPGDPIPPARAILPAHCHWCWGAHSGQRCPEMIDILRRPVLTCDNCDQVLPQEKFTLQHEWDMCICDACLDEIYASAPPYVTHCPACGDAVSDGLIPCHACAERELAREKIIIAAATSLYTKQQALDALLRLRARYSF